MTAPMRFLSYLTTFVIAGLLVACGGGGGSAGTSSGSASPAASEPAPLFTTAPASLTIAVGASQDYSISGGKPPYKVSSSNVQISATGVKDTVVTVGGVAPGAATLTVSDADTKTISIAVTVANLSPLASTAPASVTLVKDTKRAYTVSGGVPPYVVESSDNRIATVSLSGTTLNINAAAIGSTAVFIRDIAGTSLPAIAVTVSSSSTLDVFTKAPATINLSPLSSIKFDVGGGSPPYSVSSTNPQAATAGINGTVLTINSLSPVTSSSTITVRDANGKTATPIAVTVTTPVLKVSSTSITGFVNDVLDVTIYGGTAPYRAVSSNDIGVVATVPAGTTTAKITLKKVSSAIEVTVLDANNQSAKITITVINSTPEIRFSPSEVTVSENDLQPILLTVFGAASGTLNAFSSDITLLQASVSGNTVTLTTGTNGNRCVAATESVTITAVDSTRAIGVATVTITDNTAGCPSPALGALTTSSGPTTTLGFGATRLYTVTGGIAPYSVTSSDNDAVSVSVSSNTLSMTGGAMLGATTVTIRDSAGTESTVVVTVK